MAIAKHPSSLANSATEEPGPGSDEGSHLVTFIDLLSSDERFSEYLHIVQRLRMVLPLNRIRNATMFVPTNDAVKRYRKEHEHGLEIADNVYGGITDQQAWYHLITDGVIDGQTLAARAMLWESYSHPAGDRTASSAEDSSHGIMLKTQVDNSTAQLMVNEVTVFAQSFSCEAGNMFVIDGVLEIPPTILDILHQNTPNRSHRTQRRLRRLSGQSAARESHTAYGAAIDSHIASDDAYSTGVYGAVEKLLAAAGWLDAIDATKGDSNESSTMHTLWAFDDRAFSSGFNFAERAYLLYGPKFTSDDRELLDDAINDTQAVAARYISTGSVSVARLGEGKHKGL
ncbi:carnitine transporter [Coemansia sp. RSA 1813]|nr:carnitine transporter [Coemansia sp. RSA 1813]